MGIWELLFPPLCPMCKGNLSAGRGSLCDECESRMPMLGERVCRGCGGPNSSVLELCPDCQKIPGGRPWNLAVSTAPYFGEMRECVHNFKYYGRFTLAPYLGGRLADAWQLRGGDFKPDAVTYVPLHILRFIRRGYNQAELLAKFVSRELGIPELRTLIRRRSTRHQAGLGKERRLGNLRGAFAPWRRENWRGKRLLLIDDVFTTGATLTAAAKCLKSSGAGEVCVITVARD